MDLSKVFNKNVRENQTRKRTVFELTAGDFMYMKGPATKTLLAKIGKNFPECFDYFYNFFLIDENSDVYDKTIEGVLNAEAEQGIDIAKDFCSFEDIDDYFRVQHLRRVPSSIKLGEDEKSICIIHQLKDGKTSHTLITKDMPARLDSLYSAKLLFEGINSIKFSEDGSFSTFNFLLNTCSYWYRGSRQTRVINKDLLTGVLFYLINKEDIQKMESKSGTMLEKIVNYSNEISENQNYVVSNSSGKTARVFETKKNINDETFEAMNKSSLNDYFSFIEFDNDLDLTKISYFEKEVNNLPAEILSLIKNKIELRFRKLGRHNASGVFFPTRKCIGVDIRYSTSFIHELGHALDYSNEGKTYSLNFEFKEIREKMRSFMKEKKVGNLKYYSSATEIFARAFEFYFLKTYNSNHDFDVISKSKMDTIPLSFNEAGLEDAVITYFDEFFSMIKFKIENNTNKVAENTERIVAAKKLKNMKMRSVNTNFVEDSPVVGVQLSMFDLL